MKHKTLLACMLLASPGLLASPNITVSTSTTSRDYPITADEPLVIPLTKDKYQLKVSGIDGSCDHQLPSKIKFNTPIPLLCGEDSILPLNIRFTGDYSFSYDEETKSLVFKRQPKKVAKKEFKRPIPNVQCAALPNEAQTIAVGDTYADGTKLKDVFTGDIVTVKGGKVTVVPNAASGGLTLLEPVDTADLSDALNYRNANIYFVMVDRFNNSNPGEPQPYGRQSDGKDNIGTFHGGDLNGITEKLDYIQSLGTNVIWLSPIVEQVHGFVGGGDSGSFPFYGYHGYWTRDFTKIDESFGNDDDLKRLVDEAHKRGIKVLLDAVINHPAIQHSPTFNMMTSTYSSQSTSYQQCLLSGNLNLLKTGTAITAILTTKAKNGATGGAQIGFVPVCRATTNQVRVTLPCRLPVFLTLKPNQPKR